MKVGLLGDTHGNGAWTKYAIDKFAREGVTTILQLGDFGIWPGQADFVKSAQADLGARGMTFLVTPGNHEDWDVIDSLDVQDDGWLFLSDNIKVAPRGLRFEIDGCTFVSLGGAPSVDRDRRLTNMETSPQAPKQWWKQEAVTDADVENVISGGYADVLLAHDAPENISTIEKTVGHNPVGFHQEDLIYAAHGRKRMTKVMFGIKPKLWFHGHYHFPVDEMLDAEPYQAFSGATVHQTRVVGLSRDKANFSLGSFDTQTHEVDIWDLEYDYNEYRFGKIRADFIAVNDKRKPEVKGKYL